MEGRHTCFPRRGKILAVVHGEKDAIKGCNAIIFPKCMADDLDKVVD